jgi:uncharacterized protein (DUF2147 family)
MTSIRTYFATAALLLGAAIPFATAQSVQAAQPQPAIYGTWMNPYGSVAVRTGPCLDRLCGWIVWASPEAQADARDGGVNQLVGTALLENYRAEKGGSWSGTVFIPDMGRRFYSEIEQVDANNMKVKGCILHGLICKSQVWRRIAEPPRG